LDDRSETDVFLGQEELPRQENRLEQAALPRCATVRAADETALRRNIVKLKKKK
jgi:hypothetical protein